MKSKRIRSPRWPQYPADAHDLYQMLGVKGGQLPREGMPARDIQGYQVYVKPLEPRPGVRRNFQGLRVMVICPACERHMAVGRLAQHVCPIQDDGPNPNSEFAPNCPNP